MNELDMDAGMAAVVDRVREVHAPIWQAIADGGEISEADHAHLAGVVYGLLDAIDARLPRVEQPAAALKAVAA